MMMKRWATETPAGIAIVGSVISVAIGLPAVIGMTVLLFGDLRGIAGIVLSFILLIVFLRATTDV